MVHELKTWPEYFEAVASGRKRFEVRQDDRPFAEGDLLRLWEWGPTQADGYTGRQCWARITYALRHEQFALVTPGAVVLSIEITLTPEEVEARRITGRRPPDLREVTP